MREIRNIGERLEMLKGDRERERERERERNIGESDERD